MMHFNPLNMVNLGGNKIQHPAAAHSNTISRNVEAAHKDFINFSSKLKNLVMLYKTRHQLIDSLNENGLYTARCYNEIFHGTPLSIVLAPGVNPPGSPQSQPPSAPSADEEGEYVSEPSSLKAGKIDDIDTTEYPYTGFSRRIVNADEGSMIGKDVSNYGKEPEGIKASLFTSISSSKTAVSLDKVEPQTSPRRRRSDPPSKAFPDDEIEEIFEKNTKMGPNELADNVNFIVDDGEDSFINEQGCKELESTFDNDENRDNDVADAELGEDGLEGETGADIEKRLTEPVNESVNAIADEREQEMVSLGVISADTSKEDNLNREMNTPASEILNDLLKHDEEKDNNECLRSDHNLSPVPLPKAPSPDRFYFDIHKDAYKEINSKLAEHLGMAAYVEKWEQIITKRVQTAYSFYCKDRSSLNHYAKKLDSLIEEDLRNKEKNRPVKEKQLDKLDRNQAKFDSAQETHDNAGQSLLMLIEEVTLRAWRDAFPLLRKSIKFEGDYAAINQKHMVHLERSLDMLDIIGQKESILFEGRLVDLEKSYPETFYTGSKMKYEAEEEYD